MKPGHFTLLAKIAALIGMQQTTLASLPLVEQLLARVAAMVMLAFLAAILAAGLIAGGIVALYHYLVLSGMDAGSALGYVGAGMLLILVMCALAALGYARRVSAISKCILRRETTWTHRITAIATAFLDGLLHRD